MTPRASALHRTTSSLAPCDLASSTLPPSFLLQARNLARKGHKVVVIEAQQNLGGRSQRNYASTRDGKNVTCSPTNKLCPQGVWWYDR